MHVLHERPPLQRRYQVKALEYSPDGRYLLAGIERRQRDAWQPNQQGRLLRFDLQSPEAEPLERLDHGFLDVAWTTDGETIAAITAISLQLFDVVDFQPIEKHRLRHAAGVEFGPEEESVLVCRHRFGGGGVTMIPRKRSRDAGGLPMPFAYEAVSCARAASDAWAFGARDRLWMGQRLEVDQRGWVQHLAFSPERDLLAAASGWRIVLWDVREDELVARHELKHSREVTDLAFSPDGRLLLSTSLDGFVRMWDPVSGRSVVQLDCGTGPVRSVCCHPDGTTAAVGGSRKSAIVLLDLP